MVIFTGTALGDPGDAILWREDDGDLADEVNVIVNGEYQRSDLWPSCNWLYNVAVGGRRETRGSMAFLLPIGALGGAPCAGCPVPDAVLEPPPRAGSVRR